MNISFILLYDDNIIVNDGCCIKTAHRVEVCTHLYTMKGSNL